MEEQTYYEKNKDRCLEKSKEYYRANREKILAKKDAMKKYHDKYMEKHSDEVNARRRQKYKETKENLNRDEVNNKFKRYYYTHREQILEKRRKNSFCEFPDSDIDPAALNVPDEKELWRRIQQRHWHRFDEDSDYETFEERRIGSPYDNI